MRRLLLGRLTGAAAALAAVSGMLLAVPFGALGHEDTPATQALEPATAAADHEPIDVRLTSPDMDPRRGMMLFMTKGCVACHAVNGVGGHDAVSLDAHTMDPVMNPFDLAAKMWAVAPYMIAAQEEALGYQILFTGEELADIVAFVHDDALQHHLTDAMLTDEMRRMMDHQHGMPGGGPAAHAEEIGHIHDQ